MAKRVVPIWFPGVFLALAATCDSRSQSGTAPSDVDLGSGGLGPVAGVVISELMYHPVLENDLEDNHEFIEIYNQQDTAVDLTNWKFTGEIKYSFPVGATIAAHGYRVIAKNRAALAAVATYQLNAADLLGDYPANLSNHGGSVNLYDANNRTVDTVTYGSSFPWPVGPDALGAGDAWLRRLPTPLTAAPHQYMGRSLERVAAAVASSEVSNWVPSPLDGATPGRPRSTVGAPPTIVLAKTVTPSGAGPLIAATDSVKISVTFSSLGMLATPKLQYFVDDVQLTGEPITTVDLVRSGAAYEVTLPAQPNNSIVRYRILADIGAGLETISPRASDPYAWWAYFVTPPLATTAPVYQLFILKSDWNQLWDNINFPKDDKRVSPGGSAAQRCLIRDSWNADVPAVLVYQGVVFDTFVRYQGSHANRQLGIALDKTKTTINPLPDRPAPAVYSWTASFPAYSTFEPIYVGGPPREKIILNKLLQACPGLDDSIGERLYGDPSINVPVQKTRFVRLYINGGYYHYMMDIEHPDGDMMKRYLGPSEKVGDLFKADGNGEAPAFNLEGPYSTADESMLVLNPSCPMWTLDDRYTWTYERVTKKWQDNKIVRTLTEGLFPLRQAAVASGDYTALRAYLTATYDYDEVLNYIAIRNWSEAWDDTHHNHYLYKRASDGKWLILPQDKDQEFGEYYGYTGNRTFYQGEAGNPDNRKNADGTDQWERTKDAFIKAFRTELKNRLIALDSTVLSPANFQAKVDEAAATFSVADYAASPAAATACSFSAELAKLKAFGTCRHQAVVALSTGTPSTCP